MGNISHFVNERFTKDEGYLFCQSSAGSRPWDKQGGEGGGSSRPWDKGVPSLQSPGPLP